MAFPRKRDICSYALVLYICHCLICTSLFTCGHIAGSPYIDPNYEAELLAEILVTSQNSTANVSDGARVLDIDLVDEFDRSQEANKSRTHVVIGAILAAVLVVSLLAMSATIIVIYTKR